MLTNPATSELFVEGDKMRLPRLAETFKKIAADPHAFYNGSLAADIVKDIEDAGEYRV